ncbi:MAG: proline dehydrogenase family protein [Chlamydiota bacterium]
MYQPDRYMSKAESKLIADARALLAAAAQKPLELKEREQKTIELASLLLQEASATLTKREKKRQKTLHRMARDPIGKALIATLTDQAFRSHSPQRIADQLSHTLHLLGVPFFLPLSEQLKLQLFKALGAKVPRLAVPIFLASLRQQLTPIVLSGESSFLSQYLKSRQEQQVKPIIHRLGGPTLGHQKVAKTIEQVIKDLKNPLIQSVSIKLSTLHLPFPSLAWEEDLKTLAEQLRLIYRTAIAHPIQTPEGRTSAKLVYLDMEGYRDFYLTKELFLRVLTEKEFFSLSAGITLQAYLPDSHAVFKEIRSFAAGRIKKGGAPIKVRLVKGANSQLEQIEASLNNLPQAIYLTKAETDAHYKRLLLTACEPSSAQAVHIGVASHNLFDLAFALLLRAENHLEQEVSFEMLEGMADQLCRALIPLTKTVTLYCATANKETFEQAISYLIRRLDEKTELTHFLSHLFELDPKAKEWQAQAKRFSDALASSATVSVEPRRTQNRFSPPHHLELKAPFENESPTDFSLPHNRLWAETALAQYRNRSIQPIPLVIAGNIVHNRDHLQQGYDPSKPAEPLYRFSLGYWDDIDRALKGAKAAEPKWQAMSLDQRCELLMRIAQQLRLKRDVLIGALVADAGKQVLEADAEVSEAIDFAEYYLRCYRQFAYYQDLEWTANGTLLITPPWNFPVAIPTSGLCAALITGNCALFKPAPETVLAGWELCQIFWEAGIPKEVLQFINCAEDPIGNQLIQDERLNGVILTGATQTAQHFLKLRPNLPLVAETGGKNSMVITALADRDLAIKDLIQSAFSHSGQKCSAASLAIVEGEVYDDPTFRHTLCDAAASLTVGSAWNLMSFITPLIAPPGEALQRALTSLEPGESWLLKPAQDPDNPHLWSPGIKWGVQKKGFTQQTELFGPILGVMRAKHLDHAAYLANATPYGLTAGLHSLDIREQKKWQQLISAGNCYINRPITGAIVQRQPFGGHKKSSFGPGFKVGGPNYLLQFMKATQIGIPKDKLPLGSLVNNLTRFLEKFDLSAEDLGIWYASISSYAFYWQQLKRDKDISKLLGEDNYLRYLPQRKMVLRITPEDRPIDYLRAFAAALTCRVRLEVSWEKSADTKTKQANWDAMLPIFRIVEEDEARFTARIRTGKMKRIRMLRRPASVLFNMCAATDCHLNYAPVLANGRIELPRYLREITLSVQYHRYGNLGLREGELRRPIL